MKLQHPFSLAVSAFLHLLQSRLGTRRVSPLKRPESDEKGHGATNRALRNAVDFVADCNGGVIIFARNDAPSSRVSNETATDDG